MNELHDVYRYETSDRSCQYIMRYNIKDIHIILFIIHSCKKWQETQLLDCILCSLNNILSRMTICTTNYFSTPVQDY